MIEIIVRNDSWSVTQSGTNVSNRGRNTLLFAISEFVSPLPPAIFLLVPLAGWADIALFVTNTLCATLTG